MKYLLITILCFLQLISTSQTKADSIQLIRNAVKLYDLDFTAAEADSMLDNVNYDLSLYKGMHGTLPANDIPFPFAFPHHLDMMFPSNRKKLTGN